MGSPCELLVDTTDKLLANTLADIAAAEAWRIEDKFSRYLADNIVAEINSSNGVPVTVDAEMADLLDFAESLYDLTDGKFDITSGILRHAWNFNGSDTIPDDAVIQKLLGNVGWDRAAWVRPRLMLKSGMEIDLGGIGKEYAVDKTADTLGMQCDCAFLVNFGGDIYANKLPKQSTGWQVGVDAFGASELADSKRIKLQRGALATSGDAHRFVLHQGMRYGHILDPTTGWPVKDAPRSITVAAETCTQAGMLATLAMLQGSGAESFLDEQEVQYWSYR